MRQPVFAGSFYSKTENSLQSEIESCYTGEKGPGALPVNSKKHHAPLAVIVPHAAFSYSGMAAAWAYKEIAESAVPDVFIILAPNHNSASSGVSLETFQTPLGEVRVDQEFAKALCDKGTIPVNEEVHSKEHAVEVQLPFLVHALKSHENSPKIVPILVSSDVDLDKLALDLQETLIDQKKTATFIVSSDFTHFGRDYHYMPFYKDVQKNLVDLDGASFEFIKSGDFVGFDNFVKENESTICGVYPIILLLKSIKFSKVSVEQYYTSGDINDDFKNCVSYAAFIFR